MNIKSIKILSEEEAAVPQKEMYCIPVPTWINRKKRIVSDFLYMIIMRMRKAGILKKDLDFRCSGRDGFDGIGILWKIRQF